MDATITAHKTVLLIEDDDLTRDAFGHVLRQNGYAAVLAGNGQEALRYLRNNPAPDVILLDMFMPEVDGWGFLHERLADSPLSRVPVVILTALGSACPQWAASLGASGYLRKPIATGSLLEELHRCLTP